MQRFTYDVIGQWPDLTWKCDWCQKVRLESRVSYAKFQLSIYNAFWAVPEKPSGGWHQPPPPRPGRVDTRRHWLFASFFGRGGGDTIPRVWHLIELELREKLSVLVSTRGSRWYPILRYKVNRLLQGLAHMNISGHSMYRSDISLFVFLLVQCHCS